MLGNLIIGPLKLLLELVFSLANELDNPGLSIVCLSLVMNFLVLPLYRRADAMQEACAPGEGAMAAFIGSEAAKVEEICSLVNSGHVLPKDAA